MPSEAESLKTNTVNCDELIARFRPTRIGLINIYKCDDEVFNFNRGRLLLRGNNGAGKSRILALTLPFLFDGDVSPHRLEPDGDKARRIEWNLLMDQYPERLGYVWIEFGRISEDGKPIFVTLGCGLHAVKGRPQVTKWFFVSSQRVGYDLQLVRDRHPLSRDRLEEALSDHGRLFKTAAEYQREVDQQLFKLGRDNYKALVDLLIQLRQPQLTRQFDGERISAALSGALSPLSPNLIDQIADSFRSMEKDRQELSELNSALRAADLFMAKYSHYAKIASRRAAIDLRKKQVDVIEAVRQKKKLEVEQSELKVLCQKLEKDREEQRLMKVSAQSRVNTLRSRPEMESASKLEAARQSAVTWSGREDLERRRSEEARVRLIDLQEKHYQAEEDLASSLQSLNDRVQEVRTLAQQSGLDRAFDSVFEEVSSAPKSDRSQQLDRMRHRLEQDRKQKIADVKTLKSLSDSIQRAKVDIQTHKLLFDTFNQQVSEASLHRDEAVATLESNYRSFRVQVDAYLDGLQELIAVRQILTDRDWDVWFDRPSAQANPLEELVRVAAKEQSRVLGDERRGLLNGLDECQKVVSQFRAEILDLKSKRFLTPPAPPFREGDVRSRYEAGAALWQLIDFQTNVSEHDQAGLEGALLASGLLDSWVHPYDNKLYDQKGDSFIDCSRVQRGPGLHLGSLLQADGERSGLASAINNERIQGILESIGLGDQSGYDHWISPDGRWQLGPLHGSFTLPHSSFIGTSSRESAKQRKVEELTSKLEQELTKLAQVQSLLASLKEREDQLERERHSIPDDQLVKQAETILMQKQERLAQCRQQRDEIDQKLTRLYAALQKEEEHRLEKAQDLGLLPWLDRFEELERIIQDCSVLIQDLWHCLQTSWRSEVLREQYAEQKVQAQFRFEEAFDLLQQASHQAAVTQAEWQQLEATLGKTVKELQQQLEAALESVHLIEQREKTLEYEFIQAQSREMSLSNSLEANKAKLWDTEQKRDEALHRLRQLAAFRILGEADVFFRSNNREELPLVDCLSLAEQLDKRLDKVGTSEETWQRAENSIMAHCNDLNMALAPYGYLPQVSLESGVVSVKTVFQGRHMTTGELRDFFQTEVERRDRLLSEREKEILSDHLLGDLASALSQHLHAGEKWIREINCELDQRPLSTGMKLRFHWQVRDEHEQSFGPARKILLTTSQLWTQEHRVFIRNFIKQQIDREREEQSAHTWQEQLAAALDYRRWHRIEIDRLQNGIWRRLTRRTSGTGSGGEKAVALTLPQFAAACAYYRNASPYAPRLIMLDEAFVGIDSDMRKKCMGLLEVFDLDLMMTSEREWGCYPTISGLAICQLSGRDGVNALHVTRWVWNGIEKRLAQPILSRHEDRSQPLW